MMILQILSEDKIVLDEIADFLLEEHLIANAMLTGAITMKRLDADGKVQKTTQHTLKGMSKSLLFNTITEKIRERYEDRTPLIYSEPVILIDPDHTDAIIKRIVKT